MTIVFKYLFGFCLLLLIAFAGYVASGYLTLYPKPYLNYQWDKVKFPTSLASEYANKRDFSIVTFNAGLLDLRIHGKTQLKPAAYIEQRRKLIPAALIRSDADMLALQEVYQKDHIDFLIEKLKAVYPHYYFKHNSRWKLNNGLMLFSKYPLSELQGISQTDKGPLDEKFLADRSLLAAVIETNGKRISIVNVHLTSGGTLYDNNDPNVQAHRSNQIKKSVELVRSFNTDYQIVLGDMNSGPDYSEVNYSQFVGQGYVDVYKTLNPNRPITESSTWDGGNYLNSMRGLGYSDKDQHRIDHIFISEALNKTVSLIEAKRIFDKSEVQITDDLTVPLSDHYGVMVKMDF